jgi:CHAD domain-containing protein
VQLAPDLTVGDGLKEMLAGALGALHRQEAPARAPGADAIHRFRISLRRLRSIVFAFADVMPDRERRALDDRLRAAAQRYGRVREWDVFLARTVAALGKAMPDEPALGLLVERGAEARRLALPSGDTLRTSIANIEAAFEDAAWLRRPPALLAVRWERALDDYAAERLGARHDRLRKRVRQIDLADQAAFHKLRIRVKKLRYPSELLKSLFDERRAAPYLQRLAGLQQVLGSLNDALAGGALVASLSVPPETQHLVIGWLAHEADIARERFPGVARAFRQAKPFWD